MKKIIYLTLVFSILINTSGFSQITDTNVGDVSNISAIEDEVPKKIFLKDIEISGVQKYTKRQILRFTGFRLNEEIELPGSKLNSAIKKLWKTGQFSDVEVYLENYNESAGILRFHLGPRAKLGNIYWEGISKSKQEDYEKDLNLKSGGYITENIKNEIQQYVNKVYATKRRPDAKSIINKKPNPENPQLEDWYITIDKGPKVKVGNIIITGNNELPSSKIKKSLKNTKKKQLLRILKPSKYVKNDFSDDIQALKDTYKSKGFRDVQVKDYKVTRVDDNNYNIEIDIQEGEQYYVGDISFAGNTVYPSDYLSKIVGAKKGDPYDAVSIEKKVSGSEKDNDVSTLYYDTGYIFSRTNLIEKSVEGNVINLEVQIVEGEQATFNNITFDGNDVTHDHVIQRSLRTKPGDLFSKSALKRTYFDLAGMSFFDPQEIRQDIVPNQETNTVDVNWSLVEKPSSQVELQGGYGGGRFIGTLGLTFNNFSIGNLVKGKAWTPVPQGDGQQLSLRAQAGSNYQNYSFSFTEPWISGKRPTSLSVSLYNTILRYNDANGDPANLNIIGASASLNKLLNWPDNYFRWSNGVSYQHYSFNNYPFNFGTINLEDGTANNLSYFASFGRYSAGPNPIFPTEGSEFEIGIKLTPPYSLFNNIDYGTASNEEKYKWLEYYKIKTKATWYKELIGKMVLKAGGEFGFLGAYNETEVGLPPFERFFVGGTGLQGNRFDGREIIPLRGYEDATNDGGRAGTDISPFGGGAIYAKYNLELRYPITLSQTASVYGLTFLEAGNTWLDYDEFQPFELKRSAGLGVRIFMPAFGLIGFDFAYGFDKPLFSNEVSGWQTHFIIGQNF